MSSLSRSSTLMRHPGQKYRLDAAASGPSSMAPYLNDVDVHRWTSSKSGVDASFTTVHIVPYQRPPTPLSVRVRVPPSANSVSSLSRSNTMTSSVIPLSRSNSNPVTYVGQRRLVLNPDRKPLPRLPLPQLPDPFESPASDVTRLDFDSPEPVVTHLSLPRRPPVSRTPASTMVRLGTVESPIPIAARLAFEPFATPASLARSVHPKKSTAIISKNQTKEITTTTTIPDTRTALAAMSTLAPPRAPALKSRWSEYSPKAAKSTEEFPLRSDISEPVRAVAVVRRRRGTVSTVGRFVKNTLWCSVERA